MEQAKHQQLPYSIGPFFSYENKSSCVTNVLHKEKIKNYFWFTLFYNTFVTHNFVYLLHNIKIIWICSVLKEINGSDMEFKVFGYQINICEWRAKIPQTILIGLSQTIDAEPTPI